MPQSRGAPNTDWSLYRSASSEPLLIRNALVVPGCSARSGGDKHERVVTRAQNNCGTEARAEVVAQRRKQQSELVHVLQETRPDGAHRGQGGGRVGHVEGAAGGAGGGGGWEAEGRRAAAARRGGRPQRRAGGGGALRRGATKLVAHSLRRDSQSSQITSIHPIQSKPVIIHEPAVR